MNAADPGTARDAVAQAGADWLVSDIDQGAYPAPYGEPEAFHPPKRLNLFRFLAGKPPSSRDWRKGRQLSRPHEQGPWQTCSAFALAGIVADLTSLQTGSPVRALSAGHLHQCIGGLPPDHAANPETLADAAKVQAIAAEVTGDYPYPPGNCGTVAGLTKIKSVEPLFSPEDAKVALMAGPVLAVMKLFDDFWRWYGGGIYRPTGVYQCAHSIAVVGYDDDGGYWIVRNSHGEGWGESGYAKIAYDTCGIFGFHSGLKIRI